MKYPKLNLGTIEAVVNKIGGMEGVKRFLRGEIVVAKPEAHTQPFIPDGWSTAEHITGDQLNLSLYVSKKQKDGYISGSDLRKELKGKKVLNACALDYLLIHTELIPEDWVGKYVFFFGTVYSDSKGSLCVRYLSWYTFKWDWGYDYLDSDFHSDMVVAIGNL